MTSKEEGRLQLEHTKLYSKIIGDGRGETRVKPHALSEVGAKGDRIWKELWFC